MSLFCVVLGIMEEYGLNTNIQHRTATRRSFQRYDELP